MANPDLADVGPPEECLASWCAGEDWCAVTCALDVLGNKWHPVIVLLLLREGPLGFNALQERIGTVTGKVLSDSLADLGEKDVVERTVVSERPERVEYSLTPAGEDLEPVVVALARWGQKHLEREDGGESGDGGPSESDAGGAGRLADGGGR